MPPRPNFTRHNMATRFAHKGMAYSATLVAKEPEGKS